MKDDDEEDVDLSELRELDRLPICIPLPGTFLVTWTKDEVSFVRISEHGVN